MTEELEERFRAACSAYLAAAEDVDKERAALASRQMYLRESEQAADRARDQLLQVVRERDLQAQLDAGGGRVRPGNLASAARDKWLTSAGVSVCRPEDTEWWGKHGGMCPECGVSWREPSRDCPHKTVNWHPLAPYPPFGL